MASTSEIVASSRSNTAATELDIDSALAPGKDALIEMVGRSTRGREATGNCRQPYSPANTIEIISRNVATG